jgi:hypothetical protein
VIEASVSSRVKGAAVDCLTLLAEVYERAGVIPHVEIPFYSPDWNLHRDIERYLEGLLQYAKDIEGPPQPADIVLVKFGRCFAHGAIVVEWPHKLIHAWSDQRRVCYGDATQSPFLIGPNRQRPMKFFNPFIKPADQPSP